GICNFGVGGILRIGSVSFGGGDNGEGGVEKVIDGISGVFLILGGSVGGVGLIWYGIEDYFGGDCDKK
ncbi:hypothetical protein, partial [Bacillus thuringiensis]|uniref:hypothetical protein n=1 Tax=Bacillus thuringiensis TaxID=1428 RepID=UPI001C92CD6C